MSLENRYTALMENNPRTRMVLHKPDARPSRRISEGLGLDIARQCIKIKPLWLPICRILSCFWKLFLLLCSVFFLCFVFFFSWFEWFRMPDRDTFRLLHVTQSDRNCFCQRVVLKYDFIRQQIKAYPVTVLCKMMVLTSALLYPQSPHQYFG